MPDRQIFKLGLYSTLLVGLAAIWLSWSGFCIVPYWGELYRLEHWRKIFENLARFSRQSGYRVSSPKGLAPLGFYPFAKVNPRKLWYNA